MTHCVNAVNRPCAITILAFRARRIFYAWTSIGVEHVDESAPRVRVIGIGNPDRGDDAAGRRVAALLRGTLPAKIAIVEHDGEATALLACLDGVEAAFLVDACASGAPAGTVRRFDVTAAPLPQRIFPFSTHGLGLAEAVELARALGALPKHCIVYAVEGASFAAGAPLSAPVRTAVATIAERIRAEIAANI
ncbi:MAG: hydrogenase maturation protease [Acidobacteriia bacterium]|nr:hydrogenase maturation protease [Methyloceanibacter sp.]MCL6492388.1 hydrogenase maturation protease [Terriglobia bacterium]